jgi:hypothetical protein
MTLTMYCLIITPTITFGKNKYENPVNAGFFVLVDIFYDHFVIASVARQSHRTSNELCLGNLHDEIASSFLLAMTCFEFTTSPSNVCN